MLNGPGYQNIWCHKPIPQLHVVGVHKECFTAIAEDIWTFKGTCP